MEHGFVLSLRLKVALVCLWVAVLVTIPIWASLADHGWDRSIRRAASSSFRQGHDPYSDATAIQIAYHNRFGYRSNIDPPYSYVYSPITLLILNADSFLPDWGSTLLFWSLYFGGVLTEIWMGMSLVLPSERKVFLFLAPLSLFFPGFLEDATLLSGNVACILYGIIFLSALYAWRHKRWMWFYIAVVVASLFKPPFLTLLLLPVLSQRRQWLRAALAFMSGIAIYIGQFVLFPTLFKHYLQAVDLQFSYNRDFGSSPAGVFGGVLFDHHYPYSTLSLALFFVYAVPLVLALLYRSRLFFSGVLSFEQWISVLMVGILLLNPRVQEYDAAAFTIPAALIVWRFLRSRIGLPKTAFVIGLAFGVANLISAGHWDVRKLVECVVLVATVLIGLFDKKRWPVETTGQVALPALLES